MESKNCLVIGEDELTIECADILIKNNYNVIFYSENQNIQIWCKTNKKNCYTRLEALIQYDNLDYLFSIVNSKMIPLKLLKKIRKLAINYHDSLLPKFSGVNATPWAILSDAKQHGITWHIMTEIPDGGDILLQKSFEMNSKDTTLSVRTFCKKIALDSFKELVTSLEIKTYHARSQDLFNREYYHLYKKPLGNALITWESDALEIERVYRALLFGNTDNVLSLPKFICNDKAYIPLAMNVLNQKSKMTPGTVVNITESDLVISTLTNDISISALTTIEGKKIAVTEFIYTNRISINSQLPNPDRKSLIRFQEFSEEVFTAEKVFVENIFENQTANMNSILISKQNAEEFSYSHECQIPYENLQKMKTRLSSFVEDDEILFAFAYLYIYQLNNYQDFPNIFSPFKTRIFNEYESLFSQDAPIVLKDIPNDFLLDSINKIINGFKFNKNNTYLKDIRLRYPKLSDINNFEQFKVHFFMSGQILEFDSSSFSVVIDSQNTAIKFISKEIKSTQTISINLIQYFSQWLNNLNNCLTNNANPKLAEVSIVDINWVKSFFNNNEEYLMADKEEKFIYPMIKTKAGEVPYNIALKKGSEQMTYGEMITRINQLGSLLQPYLTDRQLKIVLAFPRGFDGIIASLTALKLGAVYIPIDVNWPEARLQYVLQDSQADLVLTHQKYRTLFHSNTTPVIALDELREKWFSMIETPFRSVCVYPDTLAYIIYTSGSTGQPKGVRVSHRGIVNLAGSQSKLFEIGEKSRVLQFASLSFDAAISEWSTTLSQGGCLCLFNHDSDNSIENLIEVFKEERITVATLPPSVARVLPVEAATHLKTLVLAGELSGKVLIDKWLDQVKLINAYGPTEATVCATMHVYQSGDPANLIGRPISNVQVYVMNDVNQVLPPHMVGEIVIGGIGIATGYLNREKLTSERFIPDFITKAENRYLYRTGDLGKYREDGTIEYMGRIDNQVKLRGYRIELEEIEQVLRTCSAVEEAVVLLKENITDQKCLVAYLQLKSHEKTQFSNGNEEIFVNYLRSRLPSYMIPEKWLFIDHWPLTGSGKIDRKQLLNVALENEQNIKANKNNNKTGEKAVNDVGARIAELWCKILGLDQVGLNDDFFRIGGDSITAIQFTSEARKVGIQTTARELFKARTINQLIHTLKISVINDVKEEIKTPRVNVNKNETLHDIQAKLGSHFIIENIHSLSPMQRGLLINHLQYKKHDLYFRQKAFKITGISHIELFQKAWQMIINSHIVFRTAFFWSGLKAPVQFVTNKVNHFFEIFDISNVPKESQEAYFNDLLEKDREKSFDLSLAPLFRSFMVKENSDIYYLILTFHHILLDGWSVMELLASVKDLYKKLCSNDKIELGSVASFEDYLAWLDRQDQKINQDYWKNYLHGLNYNNQLIESTKHTMGTSEGFGLFEEKLPSSLYQDLSGISKSLGFTLNSLFQFAWAVLLAKRTQKRDVVFGVTIFGRTVSLENVHKVIGLLANTVPFRVKLNQNVDIMGSLKEMQDQLISVQQHALLPLFEIQALSHHSNDSSVFDTIFIFENYPKPDTQKISNDLVIEQYRNSLDVTEFPLTVGIEPSSELIIRFGYNKKHFTGSDIAIIYKEYHQIINSLFLSLLKSHQKEMELLCAES